MVAPEDMMSNWSSLPVPATGESPLFSSEGELVCVRVAVEPRLLEDLLDALSHVDFPINPELRHNAEESSGRWLTVVEFPAYRARVPEVEGVLQTRGFDVLSLRVSPMIDELRTLACRASVTVARNH